MQEYNVFMFHGRSHAPDIIDRSIVDELQLALEETLETKPEKTVLNLWLDSPGGDAHAAYKLVLLLRSKSSLIRCIVPDYAKSAATLVALGCDELYMAPAAELGPLDVQIQHPLREEKVVSGLDVANTMEYVSAQALQLVERGGARVINTTGLARMDVLSLMLDFSSKLYSSAMDKIDPHLANQASRELKIANTYATQLLKLRRKRSPHVLVEKLVRTYPSHGYVISRDEARELGLEIGNLETSDYNFPSCCAVFDDYRKHAENEIRRRVVEVRKVDDAELPAHSAPPSSGEDHVPSTPNHTAAE